MAQLDVAAQQTPLGAAMAPMLDAGAASSFVAAWQAASGTGTGQPTELEQPADYHHRYACAAAPLDVSEQHAGNGANTTVIDGELRGS
jgi:hypothetical protein